MKNIITNTLFSKIETNKKYLSIYTGRNIYSQYIREMFDYEFPLLRRFRNKLSGDKRYNNYRTFLSLEGINMKFVKDTSMEGDNIPENLKNYKLSLENNTTNVTEQMETIVSSLGGYKRPIEVKNNFEPQVVSYITKKRPDMVKTRLRNLERIINCNFVPGKSSFLTLTYRDLVFNDRKTSEDLSKFFNSISRQYKRLYPNSPMYRYTMMKDLQKNGSIHYHICLFDVEYLPIELLQKYWKHGNVFIEEMKFFTIKSECKELLLNDSKYRKYSDVILKYGLQKSFTYGKVYFSFIKEKYTKDDVDYFLHRFCGIVDVYDIGHYTVKYCLKHVKKNDPDRLYYIDSLYTVSNNCKKPVISNNYQRHTEREDFDKYLQDKIKEFELQKSTGELVEGKKILSQGVYSIKFTDPKTGEEKMNRVFHRKYITEEDIENMKKDRVKNKNRRNFCDKVTLEEFKEKFEPKKE